MVPSGSLPTQVKLGRQWTGPPLGDPYLHDVRSPVSSCLEVMKGLEDSLTSVQQSTTSLGQPNMSVDAELDGQTPCQHAWVMYLPEKHSPLVS